MDPVERSAGPWTGLVEFLFAQTSCSAGRAVRILALFEIKEAANFVHMHVPQGPMRLKEAAGEVTASGVWNMANR